MGVGVGVGMGRRCLFFFFFRAQCTPGIEREVRASAKVQCFPGVHGETMALFSPECAVPSASTKKKKKKVTVRVYYWRRRRFRVGMTHGIRPGAASPKTSAGGPTKPSIAERLPA